MGPKCENCRMFEYCTAADGTLDPQRGHCAALDCAVAADQAPCALAQAEPAKYGFRTLKATPQGAAEGSEPASIKGPLTDEELMRRCIAGDPAAFDELDRRYRPSLTHYVRARVQPADVEDLVQDILLRVFRSAATFDTGRALRPWVFTVAHHEVIRCWGQQTRRSGTYLTGFIRESEDDLDPADLYPSKSASPEEACAEDETLEEILRFRDTLPRVQREALTLRMEGLALRQIAEATGAPLGTVASRVRVAQERVRRHMGWTMLAVAQQD